MVCPRCNALCFLAICLTWTLPALAGLPGPPRSYILPADDGRHLLVMLSPVSLAADQGNRCVLSDGREVELRSHFPSSGMYEIGSTEPLWTVDWYNERHVTCLSEDGRYAVAINEWGAGYTHQPITLEWGVRFYDRGRLIRERQVAELVDFPSLMPWTSSGWHALWIDESMFGPKLQGHDLVLWTSTRERYVFDVTTGDIRSEFRLWRNVARAGVLGALALAVSILVRYRRRQKRDDRPAEMDAGPTVSHGLPGAKVWQFGIRSLLVLMALSGGFVWLLLHFPHVGILLLALTVAVWLTLVLRRLRSATPRGVRPVSIAIVRPLMFLAWLVVYVLSFPPVMWLLGYLHWPYDVRMVFTYTFYAPMYWAFSTWPVMQLAPVAWYFRAWN